MSLPGLSTRLCQCLRLFLTPSNNGSRPSSRSARGCAEIWKKVHLHVHTTARKEKVVKKSGIVLAEAFEGEGEVFGRGKLPQ